MTGDQDSRYSERMDSSLGDKTRLLPYLKGKVLDVGCGDGVLLRAIVDAGFTGFGLDATEESVTRSLSLVPEAITKLGFADETDTLFGNKFFDTIVCSSVLHEVFSYGSPKAEMLSELTLEETFASFSRALKAGGNLVIRDGVMPDTWDSPVTVKFLEGEESEGIRLAAEYLEMIPFRGTGYHKVDLKQGDSSSVTGNLKSAMEFLYTYTWGEETFEREAQELYGSFTLSDYAVFLGLHGFKVLEAYSYLQPGYHDNLVNRVLLSSDGIPINFPDSNCIIIAEKI
jgi:SAM-dependent methyltransferase